MSDETQDAGTAPNDAGGTQDDAGQKPAGEGQVDASKTADAGKPAAEAQATEIVYDFKVPEGVELDTAMADEFKALAKDAKLPADTAQKVVDLAIKREQHRAQAFAKQVEDWRKQVEADPELGKEENLAAARNFVNTFGDDELKGLLNSTGMGNHPAVVRAMLKASKATSEDRFVAGKSDAEPAKKDPAAVLYG
mgnify:CR=1 FL=1